MTEVKPEKWEDMYKEVLVKIFEKLNMLDLSSVSQVCKSWLSASLDSCIWETLDLGLVKEGSEQLFWGGRVVNEGFERNMRKLVRSAMAISRGNISNLVFHHQRVMEEDQLCYIAERCPHLKQLVMPVWLDRSEAGVRRLFSRLRELESLTVTNFYGSHLNLFAEIGRNCQNFSALKVMGNLDEKFALTVVTSLPKLKTLSLRFSKLTKEALILLLDRLEHLEILNISHCMLSYSSIVQELSPEILSKVSRLKGFYYCMDTSCTTCEAVASGSWHFINELCWREDEVKSFDLGNDCGNLVDQGCFDLVFRN